MPVPFIQRTLDVLNTCTREMFIAPSTTVHVLLILVLLFLLRPDLLVPLLLSRFVADRPENNLLVKTLLVIVLLTERVRSLSLHMAVVVQSILLILPKLVLKELPMGPQPLPSLVRLEARTTAKTRACPLAKTRAVAALSQSAGLA